MLRADAQSEADPDDDEGPQDEEEEADESDSVDQRRAATSGASDSEWNASETGGMRKGCKKEDSSSDSSASDAGTDDDAAAAAASMSRKRFSPLKLSRFSSTGETTHDVAIRRTVRGTSDGAAASGSDRLAAASSSPAFARPSGGSAAAGLLVCDHPDCGRSFRKVGKLNRHKLSHAGVKSFVCTYAGCAKSFTRNDRLRRHWKIHQADELELGGTSAAAAFSRAQHAAPSAFSSFVPDTAEAELDLMRRMEEERMDLVSGSDMESIRPDAVLKRAFPQADATPGATIHSATDGDAVQLLTEGRAKAPKLPPLVKFHCVYPDCNYSFLLREHLKRHQPTHGSEYAESSAAAEAVAAPARPVLPSAVPPPKGGRGGSAVAKRTSYSCTHPGCLLSFDKSHKLREHAYVHTGVLPWICTHSISSKEEDEDKQSSDEEDAKMTISHTEAPPMGGGVAAAPAAAASIECLPPLSTPASSVCAPRVCGEGFMSRALLIKHQHLCHDPYRYLCAEPGCGAAFARFQDVRKHTAREHKQTNQSKPPDCEQCGKSFTRLFDRNEHLTTHMTPEERVKFLHPCPFTAPPHSCTKAFTTQSNLNQHIRRLHDAQWKGRRKQQASDSGAPLPSVPHAFVAVLRFPCPFPSCASNASKGYKLKQNLHRHLMMEHALPADRVEDTAFVLARVATDATELMAARSNGLASPPVPAASGGLLLSTGLASTTKKPHQNSSKRVSERARLIGVSKTGSNKDEANNKRKRLPDPMTGTTEELPAATEGTQAAATAESVSLGDPHSALSPISASSASLVVAAAAAATAAASPPLTGSSSLVRSAGISDTDSVGQLANPVAVSAATPTMVDGLCAAPFADDDPEPAAKRARMALPSPSYLSHR
jgi:hypothetical protein